ncbi:DUF4215 domain-containing protein [Candidatus Peregrinibacteria bacterium]|nr:DUF4215 domain-containing protein [Candidatus Peregrinibacteria bacterium]
MWNTVRVTAAWMTVGVIGGFFVYQAQGLLTPKILIFNGVHIAYGYHAGSNHCITVDGVIEENEQCDDNNSTNGDGCSSLCRVESGWSCDGEPSSCSENCGDGLKVGSEGCDDSNLTTGDGCSTSCAVESGYSCTGAGAGSCTPVCGDGLKKGSEGCDDSNTTAGDGCSASCAVETGFSCSGTPSTCSSTCGDGIKASNEGCDDGNTTASDGCSATCTVETGFSCTGSAPSVCSGICGDGLKKGAEGCDDGNTTASDGCSATCTVESGYSCSGTPSTCSTGCGDGIAAGSEACDGGGETATCDSDCTAVSCGDGKLNTTAGETCDDGNSSNTDACPATCKTAVCGDGYVRANVEECEPSLSSSCNTQCNLLIGGGGGGGGKGGGGGGGGGGGAKVLPPPKRSGPPPDCGNSIVNAEKGEECDNGRFNGVTNCSYDCRMLFCGDEIISSHLGEECEMEVTQEDTKEGTKYFFVSPSCGLSCKLPLCTGATCTGGCTRDFLPACTGEVTKRKVQVLKTMDTQQSVSTVRPSTRPPPPINCGNGVVESQKGEECDLGQYNGLADCSRWCEKLYCGDGEVTAYIGEECEPQRDSQTDKLTEKTCGTSCSLPMCDAAGNNCKGGCRIRFFPPCTTLTSDRTPPLPVQTPIPTVVDEGISLTLSDARRVQSTTTPVLQFPEEPISICGDTRIEGIEECDDGNEEDGDGCSATCLLEADVLGRCGDGILEQWEECDNGDKNSDTAPNACRPICRLSYCGDGVLDTNEECDDGNRLSGDGCNARCFKADCGNGLLELGESCDSGQYNSNDSPNTCRMLCLMPFCGDGVVDTALGERCDNGMENSDTEPDHCRSDCWPPSCGDGVKDTDEECDDGNRVNTDTCQNTCRTPVCGDGMFQEGEACDDGNTKSGDGCSNSCEQESTVYPFVAIGGIILFFVTGLIARWIHMRMMIP